jgi:hypothetical protein
VYKGENGRQKQRTISHVFKTVDTYILKTFVFKEFCCAMEYTSPSMGDTFYEYGLERLEYIVKTFFNGEKIRVQRIHKSIPLSYRDLSKNAIVIV